MSSKWVDLQPKQRTAPGLKRVGKKGEFWLFVADIINAVHLKIGLFDTCEIVETVCDNYHRAWAHTRRRQDIRVGDWKYACRVIRACQECHYFADALQGGRTNSEIFIEAVRNDRNKRMGLTDADFDKLILECAAAIQAEDAKKAMPKYQDFVVEI